MNVKRNFANNMKKEEAITNQKEKLEAEAALEEHRIQSGAPDRIFNVFQARIKHNPEQVIRYQREEKSEPLWISKLNMPMDIPKCFYCSAERNFEFQILPQLLNYLDINHEKIDALDFGTLIVYTCSRSCNGDKAYLEEYIYHQPVTQ